MVIFLKVRAKRTVLNYYHVLWLPECLHIDLIIPSFCGDSGFKSHYLTHMKTCILLPVALSVGEPGGTEMSQGPSEVLVRGVSLP